jgi:hypothetical protein
MKPKALRQEARYRAYQLCLFSPEAKTGISFEEGLKFSKDMYFDVRKHRGVRSNSATTSWALTTCPLSAGRKGTWRGIF